jgi:hypothetical protein
MNAVWLIRYGNDGDGLRFGFWFGLWRLTAAEQNAECRDCEQFERRADSLDDAVHGFSP